jgi:hypothetical protein
MGLTLELRIRDFMLNTDEVVISNLNVSSNFL